MAEDVIWRGAAPSEFLHVRTNCCTYYLLQYPWSIDRWTNSIRCLGTPELFSERLTATRARIAVYLRFIRIIDGTRSPPVLRSNTFYGVFVLYRPVFEYRVARSRSARPAFIVYTWIFASLVGFSQIKILSRKGIEVSLLVRAHGSQLFVYSVAVNQRQKMIFFF